MTAVAAILRVLAWPLDAFMAVLVGAVFGLWSLPLVLVRGRTQMPPPRPRMLYIGYTTLDQARAKGLLQQERDVRQTYNPGRVLEAVTVFIPFGKREHVTPLSDDVTFMEHAMDPWPAFALTQRLVCVARGCLETRRLALRHDVVMIGGPNVASIPGFFARLTTPARFVLFIEAFWEDLLPMQVSMSSATRIFWYRWYAMLYRIFDAYIGGPSYKPDFYVGRGMRRERIWPYIHQIDAAALEDESAGVELPAAVRDLPGPLIVSIGRLEKEKLSADCVAMATRLAATGTDFRMIMIGEGSERTVLETNIARAGLEGRVILLGAQPNAVAYAIARRADACFAPYMGTALVEVLLAGCAVVAYDNDPHRGIAGDGPVDFVPHGDALAASEILAGLLEDPAALAIRREICRRYAWNKWNLLAIGEAFVAPLVNRRDPVPQVAACVRLGAGPDR